VRVEVTDQSLLIRLAWWQKLLGLLRNISVPRADVSDVRFVAEPLLETVGTGLKVGLRLPGFYYVARTIRLDHVFIVHRGVPGLSFAVRNQHPLERVLISTPEAERLVRELGAP
jgi:hypothetical protein